MAARTEVRGQGLLLSVTWFSMTMVAPLAHSEPLEELAGQAVPEVPDLHPGQSLFALGS